jgi:hypothetical protein
MIDEVLLLREKFNSYLKLKIGDSEDKVIFLSGDKMDPISFLTGYVVPC